MIFKNKHFWLGVVLGFIAPMIGFFIYKFIMFPSFTLKEMYQWITFNHNLITVFISVSLLANAILFTIFINKHKDNLAKGIFAITVLYSLAAILVKILT